MRKLVGVEPQQLVGRKAQDIVADADAEVAVRTYRDAIKRPDETFLQEFRIRRPSGETGWFEAHTRATVSADETVTGAVSVIREVSERKAKELDLSKAATTDPLTGLLNRRGLEEALDRILTIRSGDHVGCMALFDLDHFKRVNDRYGHATGDEVLKAFASVLGATVRDSDIVARYGGEEFAVFLIGADLQQAYVVCDRIRLCVADTVIFTRDRQTVSATVSAGLAMMQVGTTLSATIAKADEALYEAKAAGRDRLAVAA